jgi:putative ABC transport system substrate-binding protein
MLAKYGSKTKTHLMKIRLLLLLLLIQFSCQSPSKQANVPSVGYLDAFQDETLLQAKLGFFAALNDNGFSEEKKSLRVIYRNAQGDIPTLTQACDYFISEEVDLIASNSTLSTITAIQKTKLIPVCMMVAPSPELAGLLDKSGRAPENLFGVYETLEYIDTSVALIKTLWPQTSKIGLLYNQAEPQSVAALEHIKNTCKLYGLELISQSVSNSSETQLVVHSLINKGISAFFALPDNTVFASFETIVKSCSDARIPVFTSEAGLVARGALAAFGADMYLWGYQSGMQAALFLKDKSAKLPASELVKIRTRKINTAVASSYSIVVDSSFVPVGNKSTEAK